MSHVHPALERAIDENPDDERNYLVYGDWLTSIGDPRGELIGLQHALARADLPPGEALRLRGRERELFESYADLFLGGTPSPADPPIEVTWRLGFFACLWLTDTHEIDAGVAAERLERLLALHSARFLRRLRIGLLGWLDETARNLPALIEMIGTLPAAARIRELSLGDLPEPSTIDMAHCVLGDLSALAAAFPGLESLLVHGGTFALGDLRPLARLRSLTVETCGLSRAHLARILESHAPLETLVLWFGSREHAVSSDLAPGDLAPLFAGAFPRLTRLGLMNSEIADEICRDLPAAPFVPALESLDLSMGTMTDAGADALAAAAPRFRRLTRLDVSRNCLSREAIARLRRAFPSAAADDQKGMRYASVWE